MAFVDFRVWSPEHSLSILSFLLGRSCSRAHRVRGGRHLGRNLTQANIRHLESVAGYPCGPIPLGPRRAVGYRQHHLSEKERSTLQSSCKAQVGGGSHIWKQRNSCFSQERLGHLAWDSCTPKGICRRVGSFNSGHWTNQLLATPLIWVTRRVQIWLKPGSPTTYQAFQLRLRKG